MEALVNFYKNRKVLVTGHTGFKGSWLSLWLSELGAEVAGYSSHLPSQPNLFEAAGLEKKVRHTLGDIREIHVLEKTFGEFQPEIVFHLAAQPLVTSGYENPRETFEVNAGGTVHLFECIRSTPSVKVVVNVTTDKCYDNGSVPKCFSEEDKLGGSDPYSASKAASELITKAYQKSFLSTRDRTVAVATARSGNVIGGGDWGKDRLIPDLVLALVHKQPLKLRYPNATRPWQHVLEATHGYLLLGAALSRNPKNFSGAWNFGPSEKHPTTVQEMVILFSEFWGDHPTIEQERAPAPESLILEINSEKSKSLLGWRSPWERERTIRETARWYRRFYQNPKNAAEETKAQIGQFMKEAHG